MPKARAYIVRTTQTFQWETCVNAKSKKEAVQIQNYLYEHAGEQMPDGSFYSFCADACSLISERIAADVCSKKCARPDCEQPLPDATWLESKEDAK